MTIDLDVPEGIVKVYFSGTITGGGADHHLYLQINDGGQYHSLVVMDGDYTAGEWYNSNIYLWRTGWGYDTEFSGEGAVTASTVSNRITTYGHATFAMPNNTILGFRNYGFLLTNKPLKKLNFSISGGGLLKFAEAHEVKTLPVPA